ncbi:hypothetical protein MUN82_08970 [Hymenobacter aerilatus]|uniref:DUF7167 domain-containing protein n=1 Tax=Hymenobacter aerilatus TaxID=2932251 RepID=A0A8T9SZC4_9BACT|nr:hypothetical protein [Hymenobacter aerilatus]UOR07215.1 hypothetical protein MUN82_08970 [Hymenobacter aerilatus]
MKIKVWCDSGASIKSGREKVIDLEADWGITDEEWAAMKEDDKYKEVEQWAWNTGLSVGWEEA